MLFSEIFDKQGDSELIARIDRIEQGGAENFNKTLNIVKTDIANIVLDGATYSTSVLVPHNLGYIPTMIAFLDTNADGSSYQLLPFYSFTPGGVMGYSFTASTGIGGALFSFTTSTALASPLAARTFKIKYYLFQEPVALTST